MVVKQLNKEVTNMETVVMYTDGEDILYGSI